MVLDLRLSVWESVRVVICLSIFQTVRLALRSNILKHGFYQEAELAMAGALRIVSNLFWLTDVQGYWREYLRGYQLQGH